MRTVRAALVLAALALSTAACAGDPPAAAPQPTPESIAATTTAAPTTPAGDKTPQGWLIKQVGQLSGLSCTGAIEDCKIKFQVDKIEVNPKCAEYGNPAGAGNRTVVMHVSMTTAALNAEEANAAAIIFNPYSIKGLTADGFVHDAQPGSCIDYKTQFSSDIAPNSRYAGTVEIELPVNATSVVSAEGDTGWAWPIP